MSAAGKTVESMTEQEKARADAIMKGWLAFNAKAKANEETFNAKLEEIAGAISELIQEKTGIDTANIIGDRKAEFGRHVGDIVRTYQMRLPYHHQANDALIKEQLKTIDWAFQTGNMESLIRHDVDSMYEILHERVYWIEQTGDYSLALDAVTTPTCFRNLTIAEGFTWHSPMQVSWVSPYKRILEKGWLRNIWTSVTEQRIHEEWTVPRFKGYAEHLEANFDISAWNDEDRTITLTCIPPACIPPA